MTRWQMIAQSTAIFKRAPRIILPKIIGGRS